jgi:class 3 adenylate cyclase
MQRCFDAMRQEIEAEGGTVEKFIGDAVIAAFGVPTAHEDDPSRALRAADAMCRRLETVNANLEISHGPEPGDAHRGEHRGGARGDLAGARRGDGHG